MIGAQGYVEQVQKVHLSKRIMSLYCALTSVSPFRARLSYPLARFNTGTGALAAIWRLQASHASPLISLC